MRLRGMRVEGMREQWNEGTMESRLREQRELREQQKEKREKTLWTPPLLTLRWQKH